MISNIFNISTFCFSTFFNLPNLFQHLSAAFQPFNRLCHSTFLLNIEKVKWPSL